MSLRSEVVRIFNELLAQGRKITQLQDAGALTGSEYAEIVQDGVNKKVQISNISSSGGWSSQGTFDASLGSMPAATAAYQTWLNISVASANIGGVEIAPGDIVVSKVASPTLTVVDFEFVDWKII